MTMYGLPPSFLASPETIRVQERRARHVGVGLGKDGYTRHPAGVIETNAVGVLVVPVGQLGRVEEPGEVVLEEDGELIYCT